MSDRTYDSRYVYGFCTWHDSVHKAGNTGPQKFIINGREIQSAGLPCCPFCGSMLMQVGHKKIFFRGAEEHNKKYPGYLDYITWNQGRCFPNFDVSIAAYNKETGNSFTKESFGFKKEEEEIKNEMPSV